MTDLIPSPPDGSPFDSIRRARADRTEYWSARDLMDLMAYPTWQHFEPVIERAAFAAKNQGHDVNENFTVAREVSGARGPARKDFELSRFGAYLVAMNGDPRKPEVAAAQAYFAIKTREAEVAAPRAAALPQDFATALRALADTVEQNEILAAKAKALEGPAAQAETFRQSDGLRTIGDLANDLKVHAASNYPGARVLQKDVFDLAGRVGLIIRGNTVRNNQPTARAIDAGWVLPKETVFETTSHGSKAKVSARLTPRGYGRLWDAAIARLKESGSLITKTKEIAA